jgi:hypothetical protein
VETLQPVDAMTDAEVLAAFGTAEDPAQRGFDEATHTRVIAVELVRARNRLATYRALYAAFIETGQPVMIENLDEATRTGAVPAKLVFTEGGDAVLGAGARPDVVVWTEPVLLAALAQERALHDYFTALLDELEPAVREP